MTEINKNHSQYSKYPKTMAYAETGSSRQAKRLSTDSGESWLLLTDKEKKQLKRSQFAFGALYPYVFDGLANAATHHPEIFKPHNKYYYELELPIDELCHLSLMEYGAHNKQHFINELLKRGSTTDEEEAKHLRCIPIDTGDYLSIQPLVIGFRQKTQEKMLPSEVKRLANLITYSECTKVINSVIILVLKILIDPIFKGNAGGWFSCPNALQAKINHTLKELPTKKGIDNFSLVCYRQLEPLFLRKHFLYLNTQDGSKNTNYLTVDAIDLWEHVSPSEITRNGEYVNMRDWFGAKCKLELANSFFTIMETEGLMKGAKALPAIDEKVCPKGVFYYQTTKKYRIYFKRVMELQRK